MLQNIAQAMIPGYSRLLISETVLPDRNCPLALAGLDWGMMYLHSGLERSEQQWRDLLSTQGLRIVCVHREEGGDSSIIEAVVEEGCGSDQFSAKPHGRRPSLGKRRVTAPC